MAKKKRKKSKASVKHVNQYGVDLSALVPGKSTVFCFDAHSGLMYSGTYVGNIGQGNLLVRTISMEYEVDPECVTRISEPENRWT